jgi:heat shock protein HtpX
MPFMILDIANSIFRKSNLGTVTFFALNALIISLPFIEAGYQSILVILAIYATSILVAFSSIGEWVLCLLVGARRMTRVDMRIRMIPLLEMVYNKAKRKTPSLTSKIILKVIYTPEPNAYAIGRRTICVTEGLFKLPDDVIQGILAHEVAHLAHRHNEIQLLIGGGNFIITAFVLLIRLIAAAIAAFSIITGYRNRSFATVIVGMFFAAMIWLWVKFCLLFLMWSKRENEYEADAYAAHLGYGFALAKGLDAIGTGESQEPLLKALYSTHPNTHDRIGRLQQMGVRYSRY